MDTWYNSLSYLTIHMVQNVAIKVYTLWPFWLKIETGLNLRQTNWPEVKTVTRQIGFKLKQFKTKFALSYDSAKTNWPEVKTVIRQIHATGPWIFIISFGGKFGLEPCCDTRPLLNWLRFACDVKGVDAQELRDLIAESNAVSAEIKGTPHLQGTKTDTKKRGKLILSVTYTRCIKKETNLIINNFLHNDLVMFIFWM